MIDIPTVRNGLQAIITAVVPADVIVYRSAFDGSPTFPSVVVGMPSWEDDTTANYCHPHMLWPIAVVVNRPGSNDAGTVDQLDRLWPVVFNQLRDLSAQDPSLQGICRQSVIGRAQFGQFAVQGQSYPAQLLTADLYG